MTYEDPSITSNEEREIHFWEKDHVRLYGLDYPQKLTSVGFKVTTYNYKQHIGMEEQNRLRFSSDEVLYIFQK